MTDMPREGEQKPTAEFWITIGLLVIATIVICVWL